MSGERFVIESGKTHVLLYDREHDCYCGKWSKREHGAALARKLAWEHMQWLLKKGDR